MKRIRDGFGGEIWRDLERSGEIWRDLAVKLVKFRLTQISENDVFVLRPLINFS